MNYAGLVVLVVATVVGICSCQECTLPTNGDLEDVITDIFQADDSSSTPNVNVMRIHPVCLGLGNVQDRYRAVSVLVEYTCSGHPSCPSDTVVEQIESECRNGEWSNRVRGATEFTRSQTTEASFSTTTENCALCVSPELDVAAGFSLSPDNVTHCVACDSSCSEGLMGCTGRGSDDCCNFFNNSMCVDECPSPFQPNSAFECVCPPGTTGFNCSLPEVDCGDLTGPDNGAASVSGTTYNSMAHYTCLPGYVLMGDDMRICLITGDWSGSAPTCVLDCGRPPSLDNGSFDPPPTTTLGSVVTYRCNEGYVFAEGSGMTRTCSDSVSGWSNESIECDVDCGDLPNPDSGTVSVSGTTYNSVANYTCLPGYVLMGDSMRICLISGDWSGSAPTCVLDCGRPPLLDNGSFDPPPTTTLDAVVTYQCNDGYVFAENSGMTRTCSDSVLDWSNEYIECEITDGGYHVYQSLTVVMASVLLSMAN